ncbi:MAG: glutamate racemase [Candidatus Gribaldobacteria bacterium]|nr:glutamate racemase [Candidatus Gribaldobacteria bacterium]
MRGNKDCPIGVFDSGFGGLEILKQVVKCLPQYDYVYLGDTARTPYGSRSQEVILKFTQQAVDFLFQQGCHLVILACNTASAEALCKIQQGYLPKYYPQRRVLGVIIPAVEKAVEVSQTGRIGVVGTEGTITSLAFEREILKLNPKIKVFQKACPLLVPIVENGESKSAIANLAIKNYLKPLLLKKIDTLILGCTHYGFLEKKIKKIVGSQITIISEGKVVADKLKDYLLRHPEIEQQIKKTGQRQFFTTDLNDKFQKLGSLFFGQPIKPQKIEL